MNFECGKSYKTKGGWRADIYQVNNITYCSPNLMANRLKFDTFLDRSTFKAYVFIPRPNGKFFAGPVDYAGKHALTPFQGVGDPYDHPFDLTDEEWKDD